MGAFSLKLSEADLLLFESLFIPEPNTGCWLWTGTLGTPGYGAFYVHDGIKGTFGAHRVAYAHYVRPIPESLHLDHLCRQRSCVNPQHLEPITVRENLLRSPLKARRHWSNKCLHGHDQTGNNVYTNKRTGYADCLECQRIRTRKARKEGRW